MSVAPGPPEIIGIEVWTGDSHTELSNGQWTYPTVYYSIRDQGVIEIGSDGYPGGTHWIRYKNGETHIFFENSIRRVIRKGAS